MPVSVLGAVSLGVYCYVDVDNKFCISYVMPRRFVFCSMGVTVHSKLLEECDQVLYPFGIKRVTEDFSGDVDLFI